MSQPERTPELDEDALIGAIAARLPGQPDPVKVRSLLGAWWRYAGVRAAAGHVVDSERFIADRSSLGLLEVAPATARAAIDLEFALLHDPAERDRVLAGIDEPAAPAVAPPPAKAAAPAPPLAAPEPVDVKPAQPVAAPEPVDVKPAQPVAAPEPVDVKPAPPVAAPEPADVRPAPPVAAPEPVDVKPAQPVAAPKPADVRPAPKPEPVVAAPAPKPAPVAAVAEPVAAPSPPQPKAVAPTVAAAAAVELELDDEALDPHVAELFADARPLSDFEVRETRAARTSDEAQTFVLALLVVGFAVAIGGAILAARALPDLSLGLGTGDALVSPWRGWLAVFAGLGGALAAAVAASRSPRLRRAVLGPGVGLCGIGILGLGLLAGSVPLVLGGGAVAVIGALASILSGRGTPPPAHA